MIVLFILLLSLFPLSAQDSAPGAPAEPDIVLPEVILQIDDLSVETIEAGLPPGEDLLPPPAEREIPLPEQADLPLAEPELGPLPGEAEPAVPAEAGSGLFAEILLGAGNMNHLLSSIALTRAGAQGAQGAQGARPRFSFTFRHEMLDGFGEHEAGSGFHRREDDLEGQIKMPLGAVNLEAGGAFSDREQGLQELDPDFLSVGVREGRADLRLSFPAGRRITLTGSLQAGFATQLLSGANPEQQTEIAYRPEIAGVYTQGSFWAGVTAGAGRRFLTGDQDSTLDRFTAELETGFESSGGTRLEARGGWFASERTGSLFPFDLTVTLPVSAFTFQAGGGYRVTEIGYADLLGAFVPVGFPPVSAPADDHGWFAEAGFSLRLSRGVSVLARTEAATHAALPKVKADSLTPDGLFLFSQDEALTVQSRLGLRWNPIPPLLVSANWRGELGDFSSFAPRDERPARQMLSVEAEATERAARWSARGLVQLRLDSVDLPYVSLGGYYRFSENIAFGLEAEDLLAAFGAEPSSWLSPFEEPGARGLATLKINF